MAYRYDQDQVSILMKILQDYMRIDEVLRGVLERSIRVTPAY